MDKVFYVLCVLNPHQTEWDLCLWWQLNLILTVSLTKQSFIAIVTKINISKSSIFTTFITIMAQTKTGFQRITQFVASSTFVASALAAGSLLNAGGAKAAQVCTDLAANYSMSMLNTIAGVAPTDNPPCQLAQVLSIGTVDAKWVAGQIDTSVSYRYSISSPELFTQFSGNVNIAGNQKGTVTKNIFSDSAFTNLIGTAMSTDGGSIAFSNLGDQTLSTIYVEDVYSFTGGTQLNSISNNFKTTPAPASASVPGPLPVIGAAMAFGYSRKLRTRIKASV